ncbi:GNAT family N-acetyltransferase [Chloroflexi bacterium TSY]|nr:GNAT family N-acetyltransferase [Chloroflexi bacterium TSY]
MRYTDSACCLSPAQLQGFFMGWPTPPSPETHLSLLRQSDAVVLAMDEATDNVVGFINAITDHVLTAYIPLLEVLPAYQGQGIGQELVCRMFAKLDGFYAIDLLCDPELQSFYGQAGMRPAHAMMVRRYQFQSGRI